MVKQKRHPKSAPCGTKPEKYIGLGSKYCASRVSKHEMRISDQSHEMHFEPDTFSTSLLAMCKPDWVPPGLFFEVTDSLRGFTEDMALIIADDIIDAWSGLGLHVTGYRHIDDLLGHLYTKILACAFKKGIKLEYHNKKVYE